MNKHLLKFLKAISLCFCFILFVSLQSCKAQKEKEKDKDKHHDSDKDKATTLHSFNGTDGDTPKGTLTLVNDVLYGFTSAGGANNKGVILRIDNTGNNFSVMYNFTDGEQNGLGNEPHHDAMFYYDNVLYGVACYGGKDNNGVIFKINPDGTGYSPVHIFTGGTDDGAHPRSCVIVKDNVFYGATPEGGKEGRGVIYKMNPDGSGFKVLYSFAKSSGHNPHCRLVLGSDGQTVYGMTKSGGTGGVGVVFGFNITNSAYSVVHNFQKGNDNSYTPEHGFITRNNNTLYGLTHYGGANDKGTIFSVNEDSSGYRILHPFGSDPGDGYSPYGSLQLSNSFLYGTTQEGGKNNRGTIFKIGTDGNNYETIFSFDKPTTGEYPIDNVTISADGNTLYCFGQEGGANAQTGAKKFGTIIKLDLTGIK
ncbi:MAG: hypothetical protein IPL53_07800 [Ignavibacteria bacterium]|nr:hypothetical protein [Ignavibacteria bacterium]